MINSNNQKQHDRFFDLMHEYTKLWLEYADIVSPRNPETTDKKIILTLEIAIQSEELVATLGLKALEEIAKRDQLNKFG